MIKVSAIVPVYNVESYLDKCLQSLVRQSLQEIEIIAVNDGSTDASQSILEQYQNQFPDKIKLFQKENGGLSDARNFALDIAQGAFIAFVDSDDYVDEKMMEEMYDMAMEHQAEMVICNLQKVDETGKVIELLTQLPNLPERIVLKEHFSVFADLSYFACNKLFHRSLFEGMRFPKGMHFEDIALIPQLLLKCKTIAKTGSFHYQYLQRTDSITKTHTERGLDILKAIEMVEEAFLRSSYANYKKELKGFQILEGVYTYLAYIAYVKEVEVFDKMYDEFLKFIKNNRISVRELLAYKRFDKNYILSLSNRKKIYYLLCFFRQKQVLKKIL